MIRGYEFHTGISRYSYIVTRNPGTTTVCFSVVTVNYEYRKPEFKIKRSSKPEFKIKRRS